MKLEIRVIRQLLLALAEKTKLPLDYSSFELMSEQVGGRVSRKYLYESLHQQVEKATSEEKTITVQDHKVDHLAKHLGFKHMRDFVFRLDHPIDPVLVSLVGDYFCYVRRNDDAGIVLKSPVRIYDSGERLKFELHGPKWVYKGEISLKQGALYVLMRAESGKEIHHVYKIGKREKPEVLQGIFSGVSTTFEPIGGRVVLIRSTDAFENMKGEELKGVDLMKSKELELSKLGHYFQHFSENNLNIKKVMTFTTADL